MTTGTLIVAGGLLLFGLAYQNEYTRHLMFLIIGTYLVLTLLGALH